MGNVRHFPFQKRTLERLLNDERKSNRLFDDILNFEGENMATNIEANNINADIKDWCVIDGKLQKLHEEDRLRRAELIIQWAWANRGGIRPLVKPEYLSAAMNQLPYWRQGPSDYLDMFDALQAVLKMIPEQKELF